MGGYTKLFSDILTSSIWNEDEKTRILWITILAMSDAEGYVHSSTGSLAHMARLSKQDTLKGLYVLESPDPDSRSSAYEGKRIEKVEGGWIILNYEKHRNRLSTDPEAVKARERKRKERERKRDVTDGHVTAGDSASASVDKKGESEGKEKFGEFENVRLTRKDFQKLLKKHGNTKLMAGIEILGDYMRAKGKKYKDHYAVLKETSWVWDRVREKDAQNGSRTKGRFTSV